MKECELRKAVFLDRDGVLNYSTIKNGKPHPPENAETLKITENAKDCMDRLRKAGFLLICITNQPDFARGTRTLENIQSMNDKVKNTLGLDDLFCCLHDNKDNCECRKPKPGLIFMAREKWGIDLERSWLIGDRKSDISAGIAAGVKTVFIDNHYNEDGPETCDFRCGLLEDAIGLIIKGEFH
jgi:D-glycero-D-manno-heptose 1,7-bisphosphate phosphatase